MRVRISHCRQADAEHRHAKRQYAHTNHRRGNVICVADAFWDLPLGHQRGLIYHEVGHLLMLPKEHTEREADKATLTVFGVKVKYKNSRWGKRLEYVS